MSTERITKPLENLLLLHKSLYQLAKQKTEMIKTGDIEAIRSLIKDETRHIQAIKKFETEVMNNTKEYLEQKGYTSSEFTLNDCINLLNETDKTKLTQLKTALENQITELKFQNDLNQQMLEQSLQFVNLSLDIIMPDIDSFNYDRPGQNQQAGQEGRSVFDSKA
ncbi:flagellar protein FlgN [Calidifontibacillus oryziterrae]|uniref:flagellar protein FlgN n=1 Tax=Calidifontibacillus oryziterrae TaxID=1191699 RepID=UPI0002DF4085|nr:flagellar protein FlgN [Calidifontibacillus oryziterrae]